MENSFLSKEEQNELVVKNLRFVHYIARKMKISPSDYDDVISIGTLGLMKAAATFDKSKGLKFATLAYKCISNEILMFFRRENKHKQTASLDASIYNEMSDNENITLNDVIPSKDKGVEDIVADNELFIKFISVVLNSLKHKEKLIMLYYISNTNQSYIAEKMKISQSYISRLERSISKKIRELINNTNEYKEFFFVDKVGEYYKVSFSSKDIKKFNKIFARLLQKQSAIKNLPSFKVEYNKDRIGILIPATLDAFSFIAQIMQEIDDFSMVFENANFNPPKSTIPEKEFQKKAESTISFAKSETLSAIRDFVVNLDNFTIKDLRQEFPNFKYSIFSNFVSRATKSGLIKKMAHGKYVVIKDL